MEKRTGACLYRNKLPPPPPPLKRECVCKQIKADWSVFRGRWVKGQQLTNVLLKPWRAAWSMKAVVQHDLSVTFEECNDIIMSAGEKMNVCRDWVRETRLSWEGKNNVIRDFSREPDALSTLIFKWCSANAMLCIWALLNGYWCWLAEVLSLCPFVFHHLSFQIQKFGFILHSTCDSGFVLKLWWTTCYRSINILRSIIGLYILWICTFIHIILLL